MRAQALATFVNWFKRNYSRSSMRENLRTNAQPIFMWVFNGDKSRFPSGVFTDKNLADEWIRKNKLTGTLTAYPVNQSVYDWAVENGHFEPIRDDQKTPSFIGNFSSAAQEHEHYDDHE